MNLNKFNQSSFNQYAAYLKSTGLSDASIQRKLSSLSSFQKFLVQKKIIENNVRVDPLLALPAHSNFGTNISIVKKASNFFQNLRSQFLFRYIIGFSIFAILAGLGFTLYRQAILQSQKNLAFSTASAMITGGRFLSFQGRLTDSSGNPIISSTSIVFKLYPSVGSGTTLYTSQTGNSQTVTPDESGIFSVTIGKSHGTTIPSSVFTENSEVWLEITAGGEVMSPRQQIATVGYALNSETLQGLPPSASGLRDTVMVIDGTGNLNLGETSPTIKSVSGTLGIEGQAVLIKATDGSGGNITINPDSNGVINLITEGTGATGFINATNANLATGNLFNASINNVNRGYNFINFSNYNIGTSTLASRFSVDAYGNTIIGKNLTVGGTFVSVGSTNLVTNLNASYLNGFASNYFVNIGQTGQFIYSASNGLNLSGNTFRLGGNLTQNTDIGISGYALTFSDGLGSTLVSFTSAQNSFYNPTSFLSGGDVSIAYDLNFTNSTGANINTAGPFAINAGEVFGSSNLTFQTYNSGRIYLNTSNVNIGSTLTLSQGASDGYILTSDSSGNSYWAPNTGVGTTYAAGNGLTLSGYTLKLGGAISENTRLNIGNTEVLFINSSTGYIGVGTTNPLYKFQVNGMGYFSNGLVTDGSITIGGAGDLTVFGGDVSNNTGDLHLSGEDNVYIKMDYNNDDSETRAIIFGKNAGSGTVPTGTNELMRLTESGYLGIGTTAPLSKLSVIGSILADNLVLAGNNQLSGSYGFSNFLSSIGGLGTNGIQRITANGNLTNIGSIQASQLNIASGGTFNSQVVYTGGTRPSSVTVNDFNGDNKTDFAVANKSSNSVSVYLNNSDGTFATKVDYVGGSGPASIDSGDLNGDGKIDLVLLNQNSTSVSVFINNGNGTFATKVDYGVGSYPGSIVINDFNGDGKIDIATANYTPNTVSVLINNGNGTFATKTDYGTGSGPWSITSADFNGDGKFDLATANWNSNNDSVLLNNGDGTFATNVNYTTGSAPSSIAAADLNGDGKSDLVSTNLGESTVSVLINNGAGTFASEVTYVTGTNPNGVNVGDLNGDGLADIITANFVSNDLSVFLNNGNGTFATKVSYAAGTAPVSIGIGDFNSDGKNDLVATNYNSASNSVFINNPISTLFTSTSGNVGIGTTNPLYKLEVTDSARITSINIGSSFASESFSGATFPPTGWTVGAGNSGFSLDTVNYNSAPGSAQANSTGGTLPDNFTTWMQYGVTMPSNGKLNFTWKASSESNFDFLILCIDSSNCSLSGNYLKRISGNTSWTPVSVPLTAGSHIIRWAYTKDNGTTGFTDNAWVDDINFQSTTDANFITDGKIAIGTTDTSKGQLTIAASDPRTPALTLLDPNGEPTFEIRTGFDMGMNTFLGLSAGTSNTSGYQNTATGYFSFTNNTTGYQNTANGMFAMWNNTTGDNNAGFGFGSLSSNTSGTRNSAFGSWSMDNNTTGSRNTAQGLSALAASTTGSYNVAIGANSLSTGTALNSNIALGYYAGRNLSVGSSNIFIGNGAGASGSYSNRLYIGNEQNPIIYGNLANGNIGLGTTNPEAKLHVYYSTTGDVIFQQSTGDGGSDMNLKYGYNGYGWYWKYLGSGSGDNNELQLWSEGAGGTDQQAYGIKQSGIFTFYKNTNFNSNINIGGTLSISQGASDGYILTSDASGNSYWAPNTGVGTTYAAGNGLTLSGYTLKLGGAISENTRLNIGNTEAIFIDYTTGNIGIGTTSPTNKLTINTTGYNNSGININGSGSNPYMEFQRWSGGAENYYSSRIYQSESDLYFQTSNTAEIGSQTYSNRMTILQGGNVGIGTTNPTAKLHVAGNTNIAGTLALPQGASDGYILASDASGNASWTNPSSIGSTYLAGNGLTLSGSTFKLGGAITENTRLYIGSTEAFYISTNGNISIGTTTTSFGKLSVASTGDTSAIGSDVLTADGTFSTSTGWTIGANWAIGATAQHSTGSTAPLSGTSSATSTTTLYQINFDLGIGTSGAGLEVTLGGTKFEKIFGQYGWTGPQVAFITPTDSSGTITFTPITPGNFVGYVDNVTIKPMSSTLSTFSLLTQGISLGLEMRTGGVGSSNIFIGTGSGKYNTTGYYNTALGTAALQNNTTGFQNSAFGTGSLQSNTTGGANTAFGHDSLQKNSSGSANTAIGARALINNLTGFGNMALGGSSMFSNTSGSWNSAIGTNTLNSNTSGNNNTAVGSNSIVLNITGHDNTASGYQSLFSNTSGNYNVAMGSLALANNTTSERNTALGYISMYANTTGTRNTAIGNATLYSNTTGSYNIAIGDNALQGGTNLNSNIAIGRQAGISLSVGSSNIFIGTSIGDAGAYSNRLYIGNGATPIIFGNLATSNVSIGTTNSTARFTILGNNSTLPDFTLLNANGTVNLEVRTDLTALENIFLGKSSGSANVSGQWNTALGHYSLRGTSGSFNIAIGSYSQQGTNGDSNTSVGWNTLGLTQGSNNVALGFQSLRWGTDITSNIAIGYQAGTNLAVGSSNIFIGTGVGYSGSYSNRLYIGNGQSPIIYGDLSNNYVGIGTTAPTRKLQVVGNGYFSTSLAVGTSLVVGSNLSIGGSLSFPQGAQNGYVLQSDASGNASWVTAVGIGGTYTATNGLTLTGPQFKLGGAITENTRLNIGNTEVFYIRSSNGNIGIGTTDPANNLEVLGTLRSGQMILVDPSEVGSLPAGAPLAALHIRTKANTMPGIFISWTPMDITYPVGENFQIGEWDGTTFTERMRINASGNVGLGTTAPQDRLDVSGNIRMNNGGGVHIASFTRQDGVQNASLSISAYGGIGLTANKTSGPETTNYQMFLNTSGNLGLGTTNPVARLEIVGEAQGFLSTSAQRARRDIYSPTTWVNTGSTLPSNLSYSESAIIGDYVYLFGGYNGSAITKAIYRAPVSTPTAWVNTGSTLPSALYIESVLVIGDYVYSFGGNNGSTTINSIFRAPVSNPTAWIDTGSTLPSTIHFSQFNVIGDYVYQFGGESGGTSHNYIYRAPITNPLSWSNTGSTLPTNLAASNVAAIGDYIYMFGGWTGSGTTSNIYRAALNNPTVWTITGSTIPSNLNNSNPFVIGDKVYLFGGWSGSAALSIIYSAPVSNPLLWSNTGSTLPSTMAYSSASLIGDNVYLFGGRAGASTTNIILRAGLKNSSEESISWKYAPDINKTRNQSLTTAIFTDGAGNIGLGTTALTAKLHVVGNVNISGTLAIPQGASNGYILTSDANGNSYWAPNTGVGTTYAAGNGLTLSGYTLKLGGAITENTRLNIGNTEAFYISTNGNISIGTTTTSFGKLSVASNGDTSVTTGSNLLTSDNTFDTSTGWTLGTGWTISNGLAIFNGGSTAPLSGISTATFTSTVYQINFTVGVTTPGAGLGVILGGRDTGSTITTSGTYSFQVKPSNTGGTISFVPQNSSFVGNIDNVSIYAYNPITSIFTLLNQDSSIGIEMRTGGVGSSNTFVGIGSGSYNTTGYHNSSLGAYSLFANTTGYRNTAQGAYSLNTNTIGSYNSAQGYAALRYNTSGHDNSAQGDNALAYNNTGYYNSAQGSSAMFYNTSGYYNTAQGAGSLLSNTTGYYNSAVGTFALASNTTGFANSTQGVYSLYDNTTGSYNIAQGYNSLSNNTTGSYNVAIGANSLSTGTALNSNIALGYYAGRNLSVGSSNIFIGNGAGASGSYSNRLYIGNEQNPIIYGNLSNGNIGLGTTNPSTKLEVFDINKITNSSGNLYIKTSNPQAVDLGGQITLGGSYTDAGDGANFAGISGRKENSTTGNASGYLQLSTSISAGGALTEKMRITSTGNVGIGTTNPLYKLDVNGNLKVGSTAYFASSVGIGTTNPTAKLTIQDTNPTFRLETTGDPANLYTEITQNFSYSEPFAIHVNQFGNPLGVKSLAGSVKAYVSGNAGIAFATGTGGSPTNANLKMVITSAGLVGIGTTNPLSILSIGASSQFQIDSNGNLTKIRNVDYSFPTLQGAYNTVLMNDGSGNLSWVPGVGGTGSIAYWYRDGNGVLYPATTTDYISSLNGISIGSTSVPNYKLQVTGDALISDRLGIGATSPNYNLYTTGTLGVGSTAYFASNVGISTATPLALLHVNGRAHIGGVTVATGNPSLTINSAASQVGLAIRRTSSSAWSYFEMFNESGVSAFRLNESSQLLIGVGMDVGLGRNSAGVLEVNSGTANAYRDLQLRSLNPGSVNLGIGTTNPSRKLQVAGDGYFSTSLGVGTSLVVGTNLNVGGTLTLPQGAQNGYVLTSDVTGNAYWSLVSAVGTTYLASNGLTLAGNTFKLGGAITENTRLNIGDTEVFYINSTNGNIGLGTTNPRFKLEVPGTFYLSSLDSGSSIASESFTGETFPPTGWTVGTGNSGFSRDTVEYNSSPASVQANATGITLPNNAYVWLEYGVTMPTDGKFTFNWKVSSETDYDYLILCIDNSSNCTTEGNYSRRISGEVDWTSMSVPLSTGSHTIRWAYDKDSAAIEGSDNAWIDDVVFQPTTGGDILADGKVSIGTTDTSFAQLTVQSFDPRGSVLTLLNPEGFAGIEFRTGSSGGANTFIGRGVGISNVANYNSGFGWRSLQNNTTGGSNTAGGYAALYSNTDGSQNTAFGQSALQGNTTGNFNTAIGAVAMSSNTTGYHNTVMGVATNWKNPDGAYNTSFGTTSLYQLLSGSYNSTLGGSVLVNARSGSYNTALGGEALDAGTTLNYTIALGYHAGDNFISGDNNIFIGNNNGASGSYSNKLFIGHGTAPVIYGDLSTKFVGLGTTAPTQRLHVSGNQFLTGQLYVGTGFTGAIGQVLTSTGVGLSWITPSGATYTAGNGITLSGTQFNLGGSITQNTRLNIGNTEVFYINATNGYIGIGKTNPSFKLDVNGSIQATLLRTTGGSQWFDDTLEANHIMDLTDTARINLASSGNITFGTSTLDHMRINGSNGNVGIGNTNPLYKFSIGSSIGADLAGNILAQKFLDIGNTSYGLISANTDPTKNSVSLTSTGSIKFNYNDSAGSYILTGSASRIQNFTNGLSIDVGTSNTGTVTWNNNLFLSTSGNVGIGTTNPITTLDVGGFGTLVTSTTAKMTIADNIDNISGVQMYNANTGTSADFRFTVADQSKSNYMSFAMPGKNNSSTLFGGNRSSSAYLFVNNVGGEQSRNLTIGTYTGTDLIFGTNNTERLRIGASGNVGIGTTNPGKTLDVVGAIRASNSTSPTWGDIIGGSFNSTTTYAYTALCSSNGSGSCGGSGGVVIGLANTRAYTNFSNTGKSFIGGDLGIGITVPLASLHVNGNTVLGNGLVGDSSNSNNKLNILVGTNADGATNGISFWESTTPYGMKLGYDGVGSGDDNALRFYSNTNTALLSIQNGGNVGIGTTAPTRNLHVIGNGYFSTSLAVGTSLVVGSNLSVGGSLSLPQGAATGYILTSDASGNAYWSSYSFLNGLTRLNNEIKLGGTLSQNTDIGFSGFSLTFSDAGSTFASFNSVSNTFYNPTTFASSGDVSMAYDLIFTNPTSSFIKSQSPLYIQTESPYANLDINLTAANSGKIYLNSNSEATKNLTVGQTLTLTQGAQNGYILQSDANGNASWVVAAGIGGTYTATNGLTLTGPQFKLGGAITENTRLNIGNTEVFYIRSSNGNIGIGTTDPQFKLEVIGSGSTGDLRSQAIASFTSGSGVAANRSYGIEIDKEGVDSFYFGINKNTPTGSIPASGNYISTYQTNSTITIGRGYINPTSDIHISGTGNIGIGTTNPTQKLEVVGNSIISGHVAIGNVAQVDQSQNLFSGYDILGNLIIDENITSTSGKDWINGIASYLNLNPNSDSLNTDYYGLEGDVQTAIGNTSDFATINGIYGSAIHYGSGSVDDLNGLELYSIVDSIGSTVTNSRGALIGSEIYAGHVTNALGVNSYVGLYGTTPSTTINWGVGVRAGLGLYGTGSITNANGLYVNVGNYGTGTIANAFGIYINTPNNTASVTNNFGIYVTDQSGEATNSYNIFSEGVNSTNIFEGEVGIGTTNPSQLLEVSKSGAAVMRITSNDNQTASLDLYRPGTSNIDYRIKNDTGTALRFLYSDDNLATEKHLMSILYTNGNVGIGNSNPTRKLQVVGDGYFSTSLGVGTSLVVGTNLNVGGTAYFSGNVGIGTTNPTSKLFIDGGVNNSKISFDTPNYDSAIKMYRWSGFSSDYWPWALKTGTGTSGSAFSISGSSSSIGIGSETLVDYLTIMPGGNIGIGTTNPIAKLNVDGSFVSTGKASIGTTALASNGTVFNITNTNGIFDSVFSYNGTAYTDRTSEAQSTYGAVYTVLSGTNNKFYMGKNDQFNKIYFDIATASSAGRTMVAVYSQGSGLWGTMTVTDGTFSTGSLRTDGTVSFTPPVDWVTDTVNGAGPYYWISISCATDPGTDPTSYLTIPGDDATMQVFATKGVSETTPAFFIGANGNIGIRNKNTSGYTLYLNGTEYVTSTLTTGSEIISGSDVRASGGDVYDNSGDLHLSGEDSVYIKMDYNNDDTDIGNSRAIIFAKNTTLGTGATGTNELMRISENGNVGIGTTNPANKLDISVGLDDVRIIGNGTGGNGLILTNTDSSTRSWYLAGLGNAPGTYGPSKGFSIFDMTANAARMTITTNGNVGINKTTALAKLNVVGTGSSHIAIFEGSGNVGIGTTDPTQKLEIVSDSNAALQVRTNSGSIGTVSSLRLTTSTSSTSTSGAIISTTRDSGGNNIKFSSYNGAAHVDRMIIDSSGNVGIGTTDPLYKLVVSGSDQNVRLGLNNTAGRNWYLQSMTDNNFYIGNTYEGDLITIDQYGYIGIGTTNPLYKLNIEDGSIKSDGLYVFPSSTSAAVGGTFPSRNDYTTGTNPIYIASGDFNSDGKDDLVVANYGPETMSVFINNGNGTFASKIDFTTGTDPSSVAVADVNNDGKPDIAVTNENSTSVSVFINKYGIGSSTFATKVDYTTGTTPRGVSFGYLNADSYIDIAVANFYSDNVSVFINNGDGTFATKVDYATGSNPRAVSIGKLNSDSYPDLAVTNSNAATLSVFINNGDGTFATQVTYATGSIPYSIGVTDVNNDGKNDMIVANSGSSSVSVLINKYGIGSSTFATKVDYTTGTEADSVSTADLDGDNYLDLAVASKGSNAASIFINNGDGTFATRNDYTTPTGPRSITTGNFNGDSFIDIATANYDSTSMSVFLNSVTSSLDSEDPNTYKLFVSGYSNTGIAKIKNLTSTTAPTLTIGVASNATGTTGVEFISLISANGSKAGRIRMGNSTSSVAYATSATADFAEYVQGDEYTEATDLIAYHGDKFGKARPGEKIAGTYSNYGTFIGNEQIANEQYALPLALRGIVDVKVSTDHGNIKAGDNLAISNIAGVAAKATQAGYIVGQAMIDYSNSDPNTIGTIRVMVNPGYYDPDITLTATGEINTNYNISDEVLASLGYNGAKNEIENATYSLTNSLGENVARISQFGQIISAKIQTGLLSATNIITKNLVAKNIISDKIISPVGNFENITTTDIQTTSITTNNLVANEATVSTLYADNIISKEGSIGDLMAAKVSALRDELQKLVATNESTSSAITGTSIMSQSSNWSMNIASDSAKIAGDLELTNNLVVGAKLMVQGDTQLANAFISGTFTAGEIAIKDNFIETTNTALYIQPSQTGSVHIMGDTLIIADNGNIEINGNLTISGSLMASLIVADEIQTNKLTSKEINSDQIKIATDSASIIIAESGFGQIATSSAQLTSNATAGTAILPANKTEIIITNNKITSDSMIYLTPVGSTSNQVPYIKAKIIATPETIEATGSAQIKDSSFTIAIDQPLTTDVTINWWIIN